MTHFAEQHMTKAMAVAQVATQVKAVFETKEVKKSGTLNIDQINNPHSIEGHLFKGILK